MTTITVEDLTNSTSVSGGSSNGTGTFDKLMNTINLHLNDQYQSGRLKGTDYANVLLGSIQHAISQSLQFTLQKQLTSAQVDLAIKDLEIKQYELDNLLPLQKSKGEEDIKLVYVTRVGKDKEVAGMGLDLVIKGNNDTPPNTYTPKYEVI